MSVIRGKNLVAWGACAVAALAAGSAGVAHHLRAEVEAGLRAGQQRVADLQSQLAVEPEAVTDPGPTDSAAEPAWQLLRGPEVVETMQALQQLGDAAGVTFEEHKALNSADRGRQTFSVSGYGAPAAVCAFLAAIERSKRLMIVETGHVTPGGGGQLAFTFGVATYHSRGMQ